MANPILFILLIHFLADFALQTHEQANKKSEGEEFYNFHLLCHVLTYTGTWAIAILCLTENIWTIFGFSVITFVCHYATDWMTSRINKKLFARFDYHNGFVGVGFDQLLHYIQLIFTFKLFDLL